MLYTYIYFTFIWQFKRTFKRWNFSRLLNKHNIRKVYVFMDVGDGIRKYNFLHTMPGYCYLTPGGISLSYTPLLRLCKCYPTLPNYFLWQQQQPVQYVLITTKYKPTDLIQYVSFEAASNETLTFYFRFEMPNIYYFLNIRVQHSVCVVCRLEDAMLNAMCMFYEGSCLFRRP